MASPEVQTALLKELKKTGKPLVLVNMSGSVMSFDWESQHVDALLQAWYGGQAAGDAITDVLFGRYNPAGRMPLTTYKSDADLPDFEDYSMANRTYRYFRGEVRYPFGYGLSYTKFDYKQLQVPTFVETGTDVQVTVQVTNNGQRDGDEVVQLYVVHPKEGNYKVPNNALKGFKRVFFKKGQSQKITFTLTPEDLALVSERGELIQKGGAVKIYVGGGQPGKSVGVEAEIKMQGTAYRPY
ncbi:Xylan 1,4-beta-xylosidase precursor [compost metagenome]